MLKFLVAILFILFADCGKLFSQQPDWLWLGRGGGVGTWTSSAGNDDNSFGITIDKNGNTTICGRFFTSSSNNINGELVSKYGMIDGFVASFNCDGELRWKFSFGASYHDYATDIDCDSNGNIYVTGRAGASSSISDKFHFADTTVDFYGNQAFTAKLDTNGKLVWLKIAFFNANLSNTSTGVALDCSKDKVTVLINSNGTNQEFEDSVFVIPGYLLATYSLDGDLLGVKRIYDYGSKLTFYDISVSENYGIYLCGTVNDSINISGFIFDPMTSAGEAIVLRFNSNIDLIWGFMSTPPGTFNITHGFGIKAQNNLANTFLLAGSAFENTKFDNLSLINAQSTVGYLLKVQSGQPVWLRNMQSNTANCSASGLSIDDDENVYVTGDIKGKAVFAGDTMISKDIQDPYIAKFDKFGNGLYAKTLPTKGGYNNYPFGIAAGYNGNVFITGSFESRIELPNDSIYSQGGNSDVFIAKFGIETCTDTTQPDTSSGIGIQNFNTANIMLIYPNPTTGTLIVELNEITQGVLSILNAQGSTVYQEKFSNKKTLHITLPSSISNGIYLLRIVNDNKHFVERIVVTRK